MLTIKVTTTNEEKKNQFYLPGYMFFLDAIELIIEE
jgi:hypothetical protein